MSPHIVDCAVVALEVGVTAGAGVGAAEVNVKNRAWQWRTNVRRILMIARLVMTGTKNKEQGVIAEH